MNIICFHDLDDENAYLSNWYLSPFTIDNNVFSSVEQYMMYKKSIYFGDLDTAKKIMETNDVSSIKKFGRQVKNFDNNYWNGIRQIVVYDGVYAKFSQNEELKTKLLNTNNAILVECSVKDKIWGIGLAMTDSNRFNIDKWQGENLLGYTLMMVREKL